MNLKVIYHYFSFVLFFQQQINKLITFFSLFICRSDDDGSNYRRVTTISKMIELAPFQWLADNNQLLWRLLVQVQLHLETKMKKTFSELVKIFVQKKFWLSVFNSFGAVRHFLDLTTISQMQKLRATCYLDTAFSNHVKPLKRIVTLSIKQGISQLLFLNRPPTPLHKA